MTWRHEPPERWAMFMGSVRGHAPPVPQAIQSDHDTAREAWGMIDTLIGAMGHEVPGALGAFMNAITADSPVQAFRAAVEGAVYGAMGMAGAFVGNGVAIAEGFYDSLQRSDEMERFLLNYAGYVSGLSRLSVQSLHRDGHPNLEPLPREVPSYFSRGGATYNGRRQHWFMEGVDRAWNVVQGMDVGPGVPSGEDKHSKRCFHYVVRQTPYTGQFADMDWRAREACERIYVNDILRVDTMRQAERLRRWAMTG